MNKSNTTDTYEEWVKKMQAEALAEAERALAEVNVKVERDLYRHERVLFLDQLVRARYDRHLTQAQLAAKVGKSQTAISRIENGRSNPGLNTLLAIAKALEVRLVVE